RPEDGRPGGRARGMRGRRPGARARPVRAAAAARLRLQARRPAQVPPLRRVEGPAAPKARMGGPVHIRPRFLRRSDAPIDSARTPAMTAVEAALGTRSHGPASILAPTNTSTAATPAFR